MKRWFRKIAILTILLSLAAAGFGWMQYQHFLTTPLNIAAEGQRIAIASGSSLRDVAKQLVAAEVLADARVFTYVARWQRQADKIRTGEYLLQPGISANELLALLVAGKSVQYSLTIPEGWTFKQIKNSLAAMPEIKVTLLTLPDADIMRQLNLEGIHPEGQFFPDTYTFPSGTTDREFLLRAYRKMQQVLAKEWNNRSQDLPITSAYEALILASIVEKETGAPEERAAIAGVFTRRLVKGMRLQTDPTVIYGMGDRYKGNIRRKDLRRDTPYNTYTRYGLTPTPISMPGREAINAALHPADGKTLYFVAKGNGKHQFSATLKQHNAAVRKYQLGGK